MKRIFPLLLFLSSSAGAAEAVKKYAWDENWPRFRTSEYAVTALSLGGAAANFYLVPPPKSAIWKGPILFDKAARNTLVARSDAGKDRAKALSDILAFPLIAYSMVDGPLKTWAGGNKDTAIQLSLINAETFAVNELLNLSVSNLVPRNRPEGSVCDPGSQYDSHCTKSFWSGHTANVFAAASLVCAEHEALDLYGGAGDKIACGSGLALASAVGVLRVVANNHHASDVIVGAAIGTLTGYFMPKLLHFRPRKENHLGYLIPSAGPQGGGLTYVKAF